MSNVTVFAFKLRSVPQKHEDKDRGLCASLRVDEIVIRRGANELMDVSRPEGRGTAFANEVDQGDYVIFDCTLWEVVSRKDGVEFPHPPRRLAKAFSQILRQWNTPEEMTQVVEDQRKETDPRICHSHDVCDSNEAMLEAFQQILHVEPDLNCDADMDLINEAWSIAKANEFWISSGPSGSGISVGDIVRYSADFMSSIGQDPHKACAGTVLTVSRNTPKAGTDLIKFEWAEGGTSSALSSNLTVLCRGRDALDRR